MIAHLSRSRPIALERRSLARRRASWVITLPIRIAINLLRWVDWLVGRIRVVRTSAHWIRARALVWTRTSGRTSLVRLSSLLVGSVLVIHQRYLVQCKSKLYVN